MENIKKLEQTCNNKILDTIEKLKQAEERGNHCKAKISIYEYYNSYIIDNIDKYLKNNNIIYFKNTENKYWVEYILELPTNK
mgnify:CR=1 FL=1